MPIVTRFRFFDDKIRWQHDMSQSRTGHQRQSYVEIEARSAPCSVYVFLLVGVVHHGNQKIQQYNGGRTQIKRDHDANKANVTAAIAVPLFVVVVERFCVVSQHRTERQVDAMFHRTPIVIAVDSVERFQMKDVQSETEADEDEQKQDQEDVADDVRRDDVYESVDRFAET